jgi:cytochrome c553
MPRARWAVARSAAPAANGVHGGARLAQGLRRIAGSSPRTRGAGLATVDGMRKSWIAAMGLALAIGCSRKSEPAPAESSEPAAAPATTGPSPVEEARTTFKTVCATCHGEDGTGNGPGAAALTPKPRNYTDKAWQSSVTDDQIRQTILMGGAAVGKSPAMPAQPQLKEKPEVVAQLVRIVRTFGK